MTNSTKRRVAAGILGVAALSGAVLTAGAPASAAAAAPLPTISAHGCTATISNVSDKAAPHQDKQMWSRVAVRCKDNRSVRIESQLWEMDRRHFGDCGKKDDFVYSWLKTGYFKANKTTRVVPTKTVLVRDNYECGTDYRGEFYQRVRMQVKLPGEDAWAVSAWKNGNWRVIRVK